jgi:hypothetical protein
MEIAQAELNLFGESATTEPLAAAGFTPLDALPDLPGIDYAHEGYAGVQIGETISFMLRGLEAPLPRVGVFDYGLLTAEIDPPQDGIYRYTLPPDQDLANRGGFLHKDLVLALDGPGLRLSYHMPVYRAFYGSTTLKGGLALLFGAMAIILCLILLQGRSFKQRFVQGGIRGD